VKVIDCFPFFDEFLILDIRFRELYDVVDKFVIMEAKETFSGKEKPLYLSECYKERYAQYADKIEIIVVERSEHKDVWQREYFQKDHLSKEGLRFLNLDDGDLILFADADEIPRRSVVESLKNNGFNENGGAFVGPCYYYKFNVKTSEISWRPKYISYGKFINFDAHRQDESFPQIQNGGWHFSYIKTVDKIKEKIESFSHQEYNNNDYNTLEMLQNRINNVEDILQRDWNRLSIVPMDDSYPEYIKENIDNLRMWIA
jgi:beta-1,4-mannosyl-glycoprotein beta-1,4-N-acetylglucosaminyltransferase